MRWKVQGVQKIDSENVCDSTLSIYFVPCAEPLEHTRVLGEDGNITTGSGGDSDAHFFFVSVKPSLPKAKLMM